MTTPQIIIGIIAVALITAILYVWGLRKSVNRQPGGEGFEKAAHHHRRTGCRID